MLIELLQSVNMFELLLSILMLHVFVPLECIKERPAVLLLLHILRAIFTSVLKVIPICFGFALPVLCLVIGVKKLAQLSQPIK